MGMLTDFFVASPDELRNVFSGWLPVADKPTMREFVNPFTGQSETTPRWLPAIDPPEDVDLGSRLANYGNLPLAQFKRVDHDH